MSRTWTKRSRGTAWRFAVPVNAKSAYLGLGCCKSEKCSWSSYLQITRFPLARLGRSCIGKLRSSRKLSITSNLSVQSCIVAPCRSKKGTACASCKILGATALAFVVRQILGNRGQIPIKSFYPNQLSHAIHAEAASACLHCATGLSATVKRLKNASKRLKADHSHPAVSKRRFLPCVGPFSLFPFCRVYGVKPCPANLLCDLQALQ